MKRNLMLAAIMAAAMLSPVGANASLINSSHSNIRHPGITVIPTDSASMKECTDAGGTVATKNGQTTCDIPEPVALAGDPIPGVSVGAGKNPGSQTIVWTQTCKTGGGIPIPAEGGLSYCAKADAVATCKAKGGTVTVKGGNALCSLPK